MRILAIDLATNIGWAIGEPGGELTSGDFRLPSTGENVGEFLTAYHTWLTPMLKGVDLVVFEAPILPRQTSFVTVRKLMGLAGLTEMLVQERSIECCEANNMKVKAWVGSGSFNKDQMLQAVRRYGYRPGSYDEADAIACWLYTVSWRCPDIARALRLDLGLLGAGQANAGA